MFKQNNLTAIALAAALGAGALITASAAHARSTYVDPWQTMYPFSESYDNADCMLCHTTADGKSGLNPYGADMDDVLPGSPSNTEISNALLAIEGDDSDSDPTASSNLVEITASTQPGWATDDENPPGGIGDLDPAANEPPVVSNPGDQFGDENQFVSLPIEAIDADDDTLTYSALGLPDNLNIDVNTGIISGTIDFTAVDHPDFNFNYNVEVTVDDDIDPTTVSFVWTVDDVNRDPVANDDGDSTLEDMAVDVEVLANDSDADDDELRVTSVTDPANGTTVNNTVSVIYTPDTNFEGTDSFTYSIADGYGGSATATVTVNVTAQNDPPELSIPVTQQNTETDPVSLQIIATDPDGDALTYSASDLPPNLTINASTGLINNSISYDAVLHPLTQDVYTVTVEVSDGVNLPVSMTFDWIVDDLNRDPVAVDNSEAIVHDWPIMVNALWNDSDPDGDILTLTVVNVTDPANGTATTDGVYVFYTPDTGYVGLDTFDYTIEDGFGGSATATISIDVTNEVPVAEDDLYSIQWNTVLSVPARGVLGNDNDADGDALTALQQSNPANGSATLLEDGSFVYTPNAGFFGLDSFTYLVSDGVADSNLATVTINVREVAVNEPPVVENPGNQTIDEYQSARLQIVAEDPNGDSLSYTATGLPPSLTIDFSTGEIYGFVSYDAVAHPDLSAVYSVTVSVSDGQLTTQVSFDWTVNDLNRNPLAVDDAATTELDQPVTIDVLANDSDPDGDVLYVMISDDPLNGTAMFNFDSTVTYTPNAGFTGEDDFVYSIDDGFGGLAFATVTIMVTDPGGEVADVFLNRLKAPKQMKLRVDSEKERSIKVFGDGDTIEQDATVVLSAEAPDGVEVEIEESELTKSVTPGGRNTRFAFEVEIECEDQGDYVILWTATIDAAENVDPSNDTLQAETALQCRKKKK